MDKPEVQEWADILGCQLGSLPLEYLGANIGANPRRRVFWKPLLEKFNKKLANWKSSSLNQPCRKILVKSCLNSVPIYWFQLHKVPKGVLTVIDKKKEEDFFGGNQIRKGRLSKRKFIC